MEGALALEWREDGVLLAVRRHGEAGAVAEVFTEGHGRHAGLVRGGAGRRLAPLLQPGAQLDVAWRARLEEHLGSFTVEPVRGRAAALMGDRAALAGLSAITALAAFALPERQPYPAFYRQTVAVLDLIGQSAVWPYAYLRWEAALLAEMGFGLDLSACAATGATEGLVYVSPRTGRAVSAAGAGAWADRLLPLPPALRGEGEGPLAEVCAGLVTTGHFLERWLAPALGDRPLPGARARLLEALARLPG
ncbi:MAG: DNA repair protein RecO [Paracoccaceae bacterium]|jgi:DNA repair protein RecO (recombination protein O)|nr:DNA repair protein RecO [Paracoccaceae bacterium]